jgi:hypothetical protein
MLHLQFHACSVALLLLLLLFPNAAGWERELFTATSFLADAELAPATHPINRIICPHNDAASVVPCMLCGTATTAAAAAVLNSAGWERELFTATSFLSDAELAPATHPINKARAIVAMSLLDCVSVVLYFAATLLIIWKARKLAHDADMHTVSVMADDL